MKDKYVLDSSVWVEVHRENAAVISLIQPLVERNEICLVDVIIAEVLRGARTNKDFLRLKTAFQDFPKISTTWENVTDLAFKVAKKGFHPPLIDLYIAQCVIENDKILITQDKHFAQIKKVHPFEVKTI